MSRFCIENKGEWDFPNRKWAIEPYWLVHDGVKNVSPTRIDDQFIGEVLDSLVGCIKATEAECDVWITPKIVVEIKADEITKSPTHTAGVALRFPRLEKFRDDKNPQEITTLKEVEKMYQTQIK